MKAVFKYILPVIFSLLAAADLSAQVKQSEHDPTFNALDYSLQKRYKPKNEPFVTEKFMDNTFVSIYIGTSQLMRSSDIIKYSFGGNYGLALGKWLDHANGLRFTLHGESYTRTSDANRLLSHGLQASYMLNLTSYMGGYRRSRFCELSMVTGLGFNLSELDGGFKPAGELHLGLNTAMRFTRTLEFFIEPMAYFHTGSLTQLEDANWKKYNLGFGVNMGMTYSIVNEKSKRAKIDYADKNSFISATYGVQFQNFSHTFNKVGMWDSLGRQYTLSFGHWFAKWFALRGTAFYSYDVWTKYLGEYDFQTMYAGLRVEGMFNFLNMFKKTADTRHSLSLVIGPEIGYMYKSDLMSSLFTPYIGLTAGIQYKFRIFEFMSVFVEPRMSAVPYTHDAPKGNPLDFEKRPDKYNYYDSVVNVNAGLEFSF